jgi:hypothetical protein
LPLISWENAVATSSAVVLDENTGEVVDISRNMNFEDDDCVGSALMWFCTVFR